MRRAIIFVIAIALIAVGAITLAGREISPPFFRVEFANVSPDYPPGIPYPFERLKIEGCLEIRNTHPSDFRVFYLYLELQYAAPGHIWNQYQTRSACSFQVDPATTVYRDIASGHYYYDVYEDAQTEWRVVLKVYEDVGTENGILIHTEYGRPFTWEIPEGVEDWEEVEDDDGEDLSSKEVIHDRAMQAAWLPCINVHRNTEGWAGVLPALFQYRVPKGQAWLDGMCIRRMRFRGSHQSLKSNA